MSINDLYSYVDSKSILKIFKNLKLFFKQNTNDFHPKLITKVFLNYFLFLKFLKVLSIFYLGYLCII